jgi:hypothetical protein
VAEGQRTRTFVESSTVMGSGQRARKAPSDTLAHLQAVRHFLPWSEPRGECSEWRSRKALRT